MTTNNAVNTGLSGATGTGNFVGATSPTLVTPTIGAATATSITFNPTTSGIVGTTTNDNAAAGKVGELISSQILNASRVALSNNTPANVTSISLTAGDWDVFGNVSFIAGTTTNTMAGWISTTSATLPDFSLYVGPQNSVNISANQSFTVPYVRVSIASTTTVYLSANITFSGGSPGVSGGIFARRVR